MLARICCCWCVFILKFSLANGFYVKSVRLPVASGFTPSDDRKFLTLFREHVESSGYFKACPDNRGKYFIPTFGKNVSITLEHTTLTHPTIPTDLPFEYQISSNGMSKEEFGQICAFLARKLDMFGPYVDASRLEQVSFRYTSIPPPSVGVAAARGNRMAAQLLSLDSLKTLVKDGFVVIDTEMTTSNKTNRLLIEMLTNKTTQDKSIRTDSVKFLDEEAAHDCGVHDQCDMLLGIAGYMNECLSMPSSSDYPPLLPATYANPLTNPYMVQAAAYESGEFYVTHSDNTLNFDGLRGDHRLYTCILYCHNESYQPGDGGTLRLHLNSQGARLDENLVYPPSVLTDYNTVDIEPIQGRLLIFDSALLHSVEKVIQDHYTRLALTVWITRPEDRPLYGDILHSKFQT